VENAIDEQMRKMAHSIDLMDSAHRWYEVANVIRVADGEKQVIYRCEGCPLERWKQER